MEQLITEISRRFCQARKMTAYMRNNGMRKLINVLIVIVIGIISPISSADDNYRYCNVYVDTLCFAISRGDLLTMQMPADFILYDIKFNAGGNIRIYYGDNPENINGSEVLVKRERNIDIGEVSLYKFSGEQYRLIYRKTQDGKMKGWLEPIMDVHITGVTLDNYRAYNKFLHNFTPCKMNNKQVICSDINAFGSEVFEKTMFTDSVGPHKSR